MRTPPSAVTSGMPDPASRPVKGPVSFVHCTGLMQYDVPHLTHSPIVSGDCCGHRPFQPSCVSARGPARQRGAREGGCAQRSRTCSIGSASVRGPATSSACSSRAWRAYIDAQLHPEKIADAAMNARLDEFTTLKMSSRDLADKYYLPAQELRRDAQLKQQKAANKEAKSATRPATRTMSADGEQGREAGAPSRCRPRSRQVQQAQANVPNELMQAQAAPRDRIRSPARGSARPISGSTTSTCSSARARCGSTSPNTSATSIRPHVLGNFRDLLGRRRRTAPRCSSISTTGRARRPTRRRS